MKKRYIASAIGAVGVGVSGYILGTGKNRDKIKSKLKTAAKKLRKDEKSTDTESVIEDAGIPDQTAEKDQAQLENSKMVSEGSQFGVDYYNKVKEEEGEKLNN